MKIIVPHSPIKLYNAELGSLLYIAHSAGRMLALPFRKFDNGMAVAVLSSPAVKGPSHIKFTRDLDCLQLNHGWELELIDTENSVPRSRAFLAHPGAIYVDGSGVRLSLHPMEPLDSSFSLNLTDLSDYGDPAQIATPYTRWKIWASERDRLSGTAEPVFQFDIGDNPQSQAVSRP